MADRLRRVVLSLAEASKVTPNQPHVSTLWRWCSRGVRGRRLRTLLIGGRRYTTEAFLREFIEGLSEPDSTEAAQEPARHPQAASRELDRLGI